MAEHFLYLTTVGRKTGKARQIEIWFVEYAGNYYMVSERRGDAHWVKNIANDCRVRFSIGSRTERCATLPDTVGTGRLVLPGDEPDLAQAITERMDQKYSWSDGLIVELRPERPK